MSKTKLKISDMVYDTVFAKHIIETSQAIEMIIDNTKDSRIKDMIVNNNFNYSLIFEELRMIRQIFNENGTLNYYNNIDKSEMLTFGVDYVLNDLILFCQKPQEIIKGKTQNRIEEFIFTEFKTLINDGILESLITEYFIEIYSIKPIYRSQEHIISHLFYSIKQPHNIKNNRIYEIKSLITMLESKLNKELKESQKETKMIIYDNELWTMLCYLIIVIDLIQLNTIHENKDYVIKKKQKKNKIIDLNESIDDSFDNNSTTEDSIIDKKSNSNDLLFKNNMDNNTNDITNNLQTKPQQLNTYNSLSSTNGSIRKSDSIKNSTHNTLINIYQIIINYYLLHLKGFCLHDKITIQKNEILDKKFIINPIVNRIATNNLYIYFVQKQLLISKVKLIYIDNLETLEGIIKYLNYLDNNKPLGGIVSYNGRIYSIIYKIITIIYNSPLWDQFTSFGFDIINIMSTLTLDEIKSEIVSQNNLQEENKMILMIIKIIKIVSITKTKELLLNGKWEKSTDFDISKISSIIMSLSNEI